MPVSDMSLQSRRWLHCEERLVVGSAAVSEAIAFTGLPAAAVLPRKTFTCESRASVPDLPANGMVRLHSNYVSYLSLTIQAHEALSPNSMRPCGCILGVQYTLPRVRATTIPIAAFSLSRSILQLSIT